MLQLQQQIPYYSDIFQFFAKRVLSPTALNASQRKSTWKLLFDSHVSVYNVPRLIIAQNPGYLRKRC